jgi:ATP-binding cassette subfamily B protein
MRFLGTGRSGPLRGWSAMRDLVSRYRGRMSSLAVVSFLGGLLEALFLVIVTGVAMALVGDESTIGPYLGQTVSTGVALTVAAVVLVARLAFNLVGVAISARLTADVTRDQRQVLSRAYLQASWAVQQAEPSGRLQELLTSFVTRVTNAVQTLTNAVTALLSLVAFLGTGLFLDPLSTGAVLVAMAVVGAVLKPVRLRIRARAAASARANLDFADSVSELGSLGLEMQTYGVQHRFTRTIDDLSREAAATQQRVQFLAGTLAPVYMVMAYAAVLAGVGVLSLVGFGDMAVIGAVMLLMLRSLSYGQQLAAASGTLTAAAPFLEGVRDTAQRYAAAPAGGGDRVPPSVTPLVATEVEFAYTADRPALSAASFRIDTGEVLGVIGPSGAGKSTLAQLVLGVREPTSGSLTASGVDLREVDRVWWSARVAFVAQEALLFTGTVAENIRFFREGIDDAALRRAATAANVLADIEALPRGFDTHLGERGSQLSGGQRQRLSIARALAGSPQLLVLDEPTSALDGQSEALIRATLRGLRGSVSIVIIAHRMSTLDICDRIMVIEHGTMTSIDTPDALRENSEFYRNALSVAGIS